MLAITGCTSFIGRALTGSLPFPQRRLVRPGSIQRYQDFFSQQESHSSQTEIFLGDLQNSQEMQTFVSGAKVLIHLACQNNPRTSPESIESEWNHHFVPSAALFEAFASRCPGGHIVFASTGGNMYADIPPYVPRKEEDLAQPRSLYAVEKLALEHSLRLLCDQFGIRATVLRISNPYGMALSSKRSQGFIGVAISCLQANETLNIIDPWETVRDYLHLEDLKKAFQVVIQKPPKIGEYRLFNVSAGVGYSLRQILEKLEEISGKTVQKHYRPKNAQFASWSVLSPEKIGNVLGWKPEISIEQGIEEMCNRCLEEIEVENSEILK